MSRRILLVAPHADDELFGAGGTLLRMKAQGHVIKLVLVACSDILLNHLHRKVAGDTRRREFEESARILSTEESIIYFMKDSELDAQPIAQLVSHLDRDIDEFKPDVIFIPEPSYHQDHQHVHRACVAALRPTKERLPSRILAYEVPTSTGIQDRFVPNVYVDVSDFVEEKKSVLKDVYASQYSAERGKLTIDGMVRHGSYRGIEAGLEHAEAFQLLREVT